MTQDQAWATARVLAKALKEDHFVAESIHHRGTFLALNERQYDVLRGRNWITFYHVRTDGSVDA
jgi:hypothetical protein